MRLFRAKLQQNKWVQMHRLPRDEGLALIRGLGLSDFPDMCDDYYKVEGGVIAAVPSLLCGMEMHIAFSDKSKVRGSVANFCDVMGGTWWAIIRKERRSVINSAIKAGFKFDRELKGLSVVDNIEREYIALRRG
ncbi:conserved hypothetical protein [Vibrio phage 199E37-1]|nr:conserved hypothetical protein [Vibrio phage 199E37-1]